LITQESVVEEFTDGVQQITDLQELLTYGANLFTIPYIDTIIKKSWGVFAKRLGEIAPEDKGKTVIVVDLPAIFHASFATMGDGASTDTIDRVRSALESVGNNLEAPTILAMDSPESNRRKLYPEYKSSRSPKPPEFNDVRKDAITNLKNNGFEVVVHDGWESDDVMASVAFRAKLRRHNCIIITDDRDLLQCCGNGVTCYSPRTHEYRSEQWLEATHELKPKQIIDWLCMMGKDDAPAVAGVGEKTAAKLLAKLGRFWDIFDGLEQLVKAKDLTQKKADAIDDFARSGKYFTAKQLHELNRNLEVHW
jgi:5'-3' exonuclease